LLPSSHDVTRSPWESFENVKSAYDLVIPDQTTVRQLKTIGFDLYSTPNIKVLNYLDIAAATQSIQWQYLDEGFKRCLIAKGRCQAYEFAPQNIRSKHVGNFWLDLFNFKRKSKESGWSFKALFLVVDDTIIYKLWSGVPIIEADKEQKNPLGPFQDAGGLVNRVLP
jgi:hypothetical protein